MTGDRLPPRPPPRPPREPPADDGERLASHRPAVGVALGRYILADLALAEARMADLRDQARRLPAADVRVDACPPWRSPLGQAARAALDARCALFDALERAVAEGAAESALEAIRDVRAEAADWLPREPERTDP